MLMTGIASVLTMNTLRKSDNFKFIILGLITCIIFYLKNLSLALGPNRSYTTCFVNLGTNYNIKFFYFYRSFAN